METDGTALVGRDTIDSARLDLSRFEPHPKRCVDDGRYCGASARSRWGSRSPPSSTGSAAHARPCGAVFGAIAPQLFGPDYAATASPMAMLALLALASLALALTSGKTPVPALEATAVKA
ncbi:hypothetical protein [Glycomyces rhizosphaerae]|uniref:MFS transporter n=1 Tax=Glycomyces rhizosphaerae TaxID=2054422 RepID=A0ABV7PVZ4_9ACTN